MTRLCERLPVEGDPFEVLVAWLDGELNAADASRVAAHVDACAACRREAALLRESGELLARLPDVAPTPGFEARVVAAARRSDVVTASRGRLVFLRPRIAAAAAVLVGVAAGVWWLAPSAPTDVLTARDEEALAEDLAVITNLDALTKADPKELKQLADDLDVIDSLAGEEEGG
jgi:anti-sigma factor RsiW